MVTYKVNGKTYGLPLGELYQEQFEKYFKHGHITFEDITDINELYQNVDAMFGWVSRSLCMFEDDAILPELRAEKEEIRKRISSVDSLQKFMAKKGDLEKSIQMINNFVEVMLVHYEKMMELDGPKKGV